MIEAAGCDRFRLEIYGTRGTIWLRSERGACAIHAPGWRGERGWFVPDLPAAPFGKAQHDRWLDGLLGAAPPERTATEALAGMLVAEALLRSAQASGRSEAVEQS
jgi:predicted dehydrogenase